MGYVTCHCQVFNRAAFYSTEQTGTPEFARNVQAGNGVAAAVKCALVVNLVSFGKVSDGRPRFVIQINVRCQHSIRATVLRLVARTIDNIPEQLQLVSGADLIGIGCCAKAVHVNIAPSNREVQCDTAIHRAVGHGKFAASSGHDEHTVAAIYRRAVRNTAAIHVEGAAIVYIYTAALLGSAVGDGATGHGEAAGVAYFHRTAAEAGRTIFNRPAVHYKGSIALDKDCTGIVIRSAAADGATVHNKSAAITDIHRTTVITDFAIRNRTTVHHKFAVDSLGIPG